jgi:hypothetical protein
MQFLYNFPINTKACPHLTGFRSKNYESDRMDEIRATGGSPAKRAGKTRTEGK